MPLASLCYLDLGPALLSAWLYGWWYGILPFGLPLCGAGWDLPGYMPLRGVIFRVYASTFVFTGLGSFYLWGVLPCELAGGFSVASSFPV